MEIDRRSQCLGWCLAKGLKNGLGVVFVGMEKPESWEKHNRLEFVCLFRREGAKRHWIVMSHDVLAIFDYRSLPVFACWVKKSSKERPLLWLMQKTGNKLFKWWGWLNLSLQAPKSSISSQHKLPLESQPLKWFKIGRRLSREYLPLQSQYKSHKKHLSSSCME